jgi:hypothetical protein
LALAKQVLYCLNLISSPFCSGYFGDGVLQTICPSLASNIHPLDLSLPSRMTGLSHWCLALLYFFFKGCLNGLF